MSNAATLRIHPVRTPLGLAALAGAVLLAQQAVSMQALAEIGEHMTWCLGGQAGAGLPGAPATFLGHCAACWGALSLGIAGAGLVATGRRRA